MNELRVIIIGASLAFFVALLLAPLAKLFWQKMRRMGLVFSLISAGFLYSAATKPSNPRVTFDDYLANDGTCYITNNVGGKLGVSFKWYKTEIALPDSQVLYVSSQATNEIGWTVIGTTTVGARQFDILLETPELQNYYLWHQWIPPTPVHTNGVWLGTILEKANGSTNLDAVVIIKGQVIEHGKVIAP